MIWFARRRRRRAECEKHDDEEKDEALRRLERAAARMGLLRERERLQGIRAERHHAQEGQ